MYPVVYSRSSLAFTSSSPPPTYLGDRTRRGHTYSYLSDYAITCRNVRPGYCEPTSIEQRQAVCPSTNVSQGNGTDALDETLGRLSKKPGVKATMVLDRSSGTILKTSGQVSSIRKAKQLGSPLPAQPGGTFSGDAAAGALGQNQGAEELASMVWNFIATAGSLVQELDDEVLFITSTA